MKPGFYIDYQRGTYKELAMFRMETSSDLSITNKTMIVLGLPLNEVIKTVVLMGSIHYLC